MEEKSINIHLVKELYKNRWLILGTVLFFLALSIAVYFFTPKKYTATAVVYPASSNNIDEVVSNLSFGYEIHADRTLQLLKSEPMKNQLVKEFDLIKYYELDTTNNTWYHQLSEKYERDITFARTEHLAVMIRVSLKDPFMAADIANKAIYYLDSIQKMIFISSLEEFKVKLEENIANEQLAVDNTLSVILDKVDANQSENPISTKKLNSLLHDQETGNSKAGDALIIEILKSGTSVEIEKLINDYYIQLGSLNSLKGKLEKIDETITMPFPKVHVVSRAFPNEKPSSPRLLWNLVLGLLIGLIVSVGFVLTKAGMRNIKDSALSK